MKKEIFNKLNEKVTELEKLINGGAGSGNFGHEGRPGLVGGSGGKGIGVSGPKSSGVVVDKKDAKEISQDIKKWGESDKPNDSDNTTLKSVLKKTDDALGRVGIKPADSSKTWSKIVADKDAQTETQLSSKEGLQAIVGLMKKQLANPSSTYDGKPYYRDAHDTMRQLGDFLDGKGNVIIVRDTSGPHIQIKDRPYQNS